MKIGVESGLWTTGNVERALPLVTVLEVSGAVMSWTLDEPNSPQIEFTDASRADWLWRVVGERGHVAVAAVTEGPTDSAVAIELDGIDVDTEAVEIPRRLALGHWLRRWWPAGVGDGITALDLPLLDAEIAILTSAAEIFFTDDTIDSGVAELLSPHAAALTEHVRSGDPRVVEMVRRCVDLWRRWGSAIRFTGQSGLSSRHSLRTWTHSIRRHRDVRMITPWQREVVRRLEAMRSPPAPTRFAGVVCLRESSMLPRTPSTGTCEPTRLPP